MPEQYEEPMRTYQYQPVVSILFPGYRKTNYGGNESVFPELFYRRRQWQRPGSLGYRILLRTFPNFLDIQTYQFVIQTNKVYFLTSYDYIIVMKTSIW